MGPRINLGDWIEGPSICKLNSSIDHAACSFTRACLSPLSGYSGECTNKQVTTYIPRRFVGRSVNNQHR
jgi:hypothetical protein